VTCWRRLRDWTQAGVWPVLNELLLAQLRALGGLDLDRCAVDGSHVRALNGDHVGPSPVDRGRPGSKHHLICDAGGLPLAVTLTGGNRNDITQLIPLLDAVPPIRGRRGRPRRKPRELFADRGYDHDIYRRQLRARGITPRIARRGIAHGSGLGRHRWVVERGFAWLHAFKRFLSPGGASSYPNAYPNRDGSANVRQRPSLTPQAADLRRCTPANVSARSSLP
jgi:transposase